MMKHKTLAIAIALSVSASFGLSGAAYAQAAQRIKQNNAWGSYSHDGQKGKICYILSMPPQDQKFPSDRDHGDVFFMLAEYPGQSTDLEPQFMVGYSFKDNSKVTLDIDGKKFSMFTRGHNAWMENPAEDSLVVEAMKAGRQMQLSGESQRGTQTRYVFSLSGVTASLSDIQSCN